MKRSRMRPLHHPATSRMNSVGDMNAHRACHILAVAIPRMVLSFGLTEAPRENVEPSCCLLRARALLASGSRIRCSDVLDYHPDHDVAVAHWTHVTGARHDAESPGIHRHGEFARQQFG